MLYRLTGSSNLMIGAAYSIRSYQELAETIGPLGKYLPIRCRIEPGATLVDVAEQLDQVCQEAEIWQESFTWDDMNGVSDGDQSMLFFPFQFEYWEVPETLSAGSARISLIAVQDHRERFDLKLCCVRHPATLEIQIHYDPSVLGTDAAARFADEMMTLIESATGHESEPIYRLNILSRDERNELLTLATVLETPIPVGEYIHNLIDQPDIQTIALAFEDVEVSYSHLSIRSNQLAGYLQELGVEEDVRVGIYMDRSPDAIVSILGVLKSGGAYVPLDPEHPRERLTYILRDAGVSVVLTHSDLAGRLPDLDAKSICLDAEWEEISSRSAERDCRNISPEALAYVIYTSGSTGAPKGVGVSHRNLLSSTMARRHFYQNGPERFLLLSPLTFDSSIAGIFWTLLEGGTLVLTPGDVQRDPIQLAKILTRRSVSHTLALPSLYHYILEAADPAQTSSLQLAIVAGEACPSNLPLLHLSKSPHADLVNEYGPTEGAVWSTAYRCAVGSPEIKIPIGRPIANASAYVLDNSGELAPLGVAGELFIAGPGIARGYLNRVAETAEKFAPNLFPRRPG
jgi:amino acid adenylation domain-containing protein